MNYRPAGIAVKRSSVYLLVAAIACGGSDLVLPGPSSPAEAGLPADIEIVKGNGQSGMPGAVLPDSIVVKVTDSAGTPLAGARVEFAPSAPGAVVTPQTTSTNADGIAGARWVLGSTNGTQLVIARVVGNGAPDGIETAFEASVGPGSAARIQLADGDDQTGPVGVALPAPLVVLVTDQLGNPVADVGVSWDAQDGTVNPSSSRTGPDGRATTSWELGSSTGPQRATASRDGLDGSPVRFTSTALPGTADDLVRVGGNGQSGRPGEELNDPLIVRLVDREGNGIPGQAVTWVVGLGGGQVASTTTLTDGEGEAQTRWTLGPAAGTNTLNAVVSGVAVVAFIATATGDGGGGGGGGDSKPTRMRFVVHPTDVPHKHEIISPPVVVEVLDQSGNRVTNREFTIRLDLIAIKDGRSMGHEQARTESGVATYPNLRINVVGEFLLRATAAGLPPVDSERFVTHE